MKTSIEENEKQSIDIILQSCKELYYASKNSGSKSLDSSSVKTDENNVKSIQIFTSYNSGDEQAFVRTKVTWLTIPSNRGNDLISIKHSDNWSLESYNTYDQITHQTIQYPDFSAKQIYEWSNMIQEIIQIIILIL